MNMVAVGLSCIILMVLFVATLYGLMAALLLAGLAALVYLAGCYVR